MPRWLRSTLYPQKLAITSPTSGGRSVGVFRSRTQTMEFFFVGEDPVPTSPRPTFKSEVPQLHVRGVPDLQRLARDL
jgi:hypothetical protein